MYEKIVSFQALMG